VGCRKRLRLEDVGVAGQLRADGLAAPLFSSLPDAAVLSMQ
jgi:hypothetical protein